MGPCRYSPYAGEIDFLAGFKVRPNGAFGAGVDHDALIGDRAFRALRAEIGRFNPFFAMGLDQNEVPHSNFLAYLMDPGGSHGLGSTVLTMMFPCFEASDPSDIVVLREHGISGHGLVRQKRLDVIAYDAARKIVGIIELKVGSKESKDQRLAYRTWASGYFGDDWHYAFIFLTNPKTSQETGIAPAWHAPSMRRAADLDAIAGPSEDRIWAPLSYASLSSHLMAIARTPSPARQALRDYVAFLGLYICPAQGRFRRLADRLWARHSVSIQALIEARSKLRRSLIVQLNPKFAALGLTVGANNGADVFSLVAIEAGGLTIPNKPHVLIFTLNPWSESPALCVDVSPPDPDLCRVLRQSFRYKEDSKVKQRVLSYPLALPSRRRPFPFTQNATSRILAHLQDVIDRVARDHLHHGLANTKIH